VVRGSSGGGGSGGGGGGQSSGGVAERAFHPEELRSDASLCIDAEYYLGQQVLPVVVRLCAPIEVRCWCGQWARTTRAGTRTHLGADE
jgi:DNA polymerase elongation subunit (family B)